MNNKIRHLEFVQNIIVRMAKNSFSLKGWAVTLVSGLLMVGSVVGSNILVCLIVLLPIIVFWVLDSYYLLQERRYRALYNKIRDMDENQIDFDLNANQAQFKNGNNFMRKCLFSKTELWFYLSLIMISASIILLVYFT
ncbi:MAG: hypothetical protein J1F18_05605 [Lachnospiraceae bacterium]|nr:hypothetical protein [Lachnospiraceae bacterium]